MGLPVVVGQPARAPQEDVIERNFYILRSDLEKYWHTPLCPGCKAQMCDLPHRSRNAECRMRIQNELLKTEEGRG